MNPKYKKHINFAKTIENAISVLDTKALNLVKELVQEKMKTDSYLVENNAHCFCISMGRYWFTDIDLKWIEMDKWGNDGGNGHETWKDVSNFMDTICELLRLDLNLCIIHLDSDEIDFR